MTQVYKIQVSMNQAHLVKSGFVFKQGDFGFQIEIEVLDFDVTGTTPQIIFRKPSGAVESTSVSASGNKFTYTMRGTELDTPGPAICDLKLKNSTTQRISTASFSYFVESDTMDGLHQQAGSYSDTIKQIIDGYEEELGTFETALGEAEVIAFPSPEVNTGYYIKTNGDFEAASTFVYTNPIYLQKGDTIKLKGRGYSNAVGMISICDSTNTTRFPVIVSIDSSNHEYVYNASMNVYVCLCWDNGADHDIVILYNEGKTDPTIEDILDCKINPSTITRVKYMVYNNTYYSHSNYITSDPILLKKGQKIVAHLRCEAIVQAVSECLVDGTLIASLINGKGASLETYEYTASKDMYVCLCNYLGRPNVSDFDAYVAEDSDLIKMSFSIFERWGVIGDSFASGVFKDATSGSLTNHLQKSWAQIIARASGNTCINFTKGGLYCGSWLTDPDRGLPLLLSSDAQELYIIALGINDVSKLSGEQPIGTSADMNDDYSLNPSTFYGNYGKIIGNIQDHAPKSKIILSTIPYTGESPMIINSAIMNIAEIKGFPCLMVHTDEFFKSSYFWNNFEQDHPKSFLYGAMANAYDRLICDCIKNNPSYWGDTFN